MGPNMLSEEMLDLVIRVDMVKVLMSFFLFSSYACS